jgi:hypothetical protein
VGGATFYFEDDFLVELGQTGGYQMKCLISDCKKNVIKNGLYCAAHQYVSQPNPGVHSVREAAGDPPIIITGGSITIEFDDMQLQGDKGRRHNPNKKIKRIVVTGSGPNIDLSVNDPKDVTIKVYYGD